jgi:hypothetical protein
MVLGCQVNCRGDGDVYRVADHDSRCPDTEGAAIEPGVRGHGRGPVLPSPGSERCGRLRWRVPGCRGGSGVRAVRDVRRGVLGTRQCCGVAGVLVVLEDLQWADRTSLLLRHLAGELARSRLLVVGTFREPPGVPLADLLPALLRPGGTGPIRLTGLSRPDIAHWLRRLETAAMSRSRASVGDAQQNPSVVSQRTPAPPNFFNHSF